MLYEVLLTKQAVRDVEDLYDYIKSHDSHDKADKVLQNLEQCFEKLSHMPDRGTHLKELVALGIKTYRQVYYKPYRIIYTIADKAVYVQLITDGRQDMQTLLLRKLLGVYQE